MMTDAARTVTCAWCGSAEPLTSSVEAMTEELVEVFGENARGELLAIVCDDCWEKLRPPAGVVDG